MSHVSIKRPSTSARASVPTSRRSMLGHASLGVGDTIPHETIARLAFQKWQQRGCPLGDDLRDWFDAEGELKTRKSQSPGSARGR